MRNKIVNKQIPISSIIDVANYLEKYKEDYLKKDYSEIKVEKPNISHIENTVKTSSNEVKPSFTKI